MRRGWMLLLACLGALTTLILGCQRRAIFPGGGAAPTADLVTRHPGAIALDIRHPDGRCEGILLPSPTGKPNAPVVVFAHGNAELIDHWIPRLRPYHRWGVSIALLEYRGYGRSDGSPSQEALVQDLIAFVDALGTRPEVNADRIIYHGRSLGGGVVSAVAAARPPAGLILESTFTGLADLVWENWYLPPIFVRDPFDSTTALADWRGPALVVHGRDDALIAFAHGQTLSTQLNAPLLAQPCGHNDCIRDARYWQAIGTVIQAVGN